MKATILTFIVGMILLECKLCDCRVKESLKSVGALIAQLVSTTLYGVAFSEALGVVSISSSLVIMLKFVELCINVVEM